MSLDLAACSDGELAALTLGGRQAAYAEIVRRHRDGIYRLIRGHIGDADEALDLTQEALLSAYRALARYDRDRPFAAWLSRIALNKCRDWGRRRAVRRLFTFAAPLSEGEQIADPQAAPDVEAADRQALDRLWHAIATLPVNLKEPLLLCTVEEMAQAEAARTLGISEKAVETRLYRARKKLAVLLAEDFPAPV